MPAKLPDELVARMWSDYERLKSLKKVAALYGRKFPTIYALFLRRGLIKPENKTHSPEYAQRMIDLYREHKSTYKVAAILGKSAMSVWSWLNARGLTNPKRPVQKGMVVYKGERFTPSAKGGYYRSTRMATRRRGRSRLLHHVVWEDHHGPVPKNHVVRFKDGNRSNCAIGNLKCLTHSEARVGIYTGNGFTVWDTRRRDLQRAVAILEAEHCVTQKMIEARSALAAHETLRPIMGGDAKTKRRRMLRCWKKRTPEVRAALFGKMQAAKRAGRRAQYAELPAYALAMLPDRDRQVLRRFFLEGETYDEIAPAFGVTGSAVFAIKRRALKKLPQFARVLEERVAGVELWIIKEANRLAFRYQGIDAEDLKQEGRKSAFEAAQKFDPARGYKFLTYCKQGIAWRMDLYVRNQSQQVRVPADKFFSHRLGFTSLDAPLSTDEGEGNAFGDIFCGEAESTTGSLDFNDRTELLKGLLAQLAPKEQEILRQRFFENRTLEEVGGDFGVSRERIRQIEAKALRRIRTMPGLKKLQEAA